MPPKPFVGLPQSLTDTDRAACLEVLKEGKAVDIEFAAAEFPHALRVAVLRVGTSIIGVSAIKRARPAYAAGVAKKSGCEFPDDLPELGYVALREAYWGDHLGEVLVQQILGSYGKGPLWATTSHGGMKKHLARAGFESFGKSWPNKDGVALTLWLRK